MTDINSASAILAIKPNYLAFKTLKLLCTCFIHRSREFAAGISASLEYVTMFISNKTYLDLEAAFSMPGVSMFYGAFGFVG